MLVNKIHFVFDDTKCKTTTNEKDKNLDVTGITTTDMYTLSYYNYKTCHGCEGKGWVNCEGIAQKCPVCEGKGKIYSEQKKVDYPIYPTYPWYIPCSFN